jgi:hypothetical protein
MNSLDIIVPDPNPENSILIRFEREILTLDTIGIIILNTNAIWFIVKS